MLAPALAFALQSLWIASGTDRSFFWSGIVSIAGATDSDPIAQAWPPARHANFP